MGQGAGTLRAPWEEAQDPKDEAQVQGQRPATRHHQAPDELNNLPGLAQPSPIHSVISR